MAQTTFSLEYILSLIVAIGAYYLVSKTSNNVPLWTALLVGLFAGYISLLLFNTLIPSLNTFGKNVGTYVVNKTYSGVDNMNYFMLFPPLLAILIVFVVLLYNGALG
jgi:uncharacterized membrane protein YagU involved in acid resistance